MLLPHQPALVLAPMQGLTDAPMRAVCAEAGAFTFAVSEFLRISSEVPPMRVFYRHVPELHHGGRTPNGLPVQVQLLGGHAGRMAQAAWMAYQAGAGAIDINFGCPAPTVNRHDGGAALLNHPCRIREIVAAVRDALPSHVPVSAKMRLGWDTQDAVLENADMAAEGGASWITIHGRTRVQGYTPPAYWNPIGLVRERLDIPVVANGDIWSVGDFRRCREETGCTHFMLGRGALADPRLPLLIARELRIAPPGSDTGLDDTSSNAPFDWVSPLQSLAAWTERIEGETTPVLVCRLKQWLKLAGRHGGFTDFDLIKRVQSAEELFALLSASCPSHSPGSGEKPGSVHQILPAG